MNKKILLLVGLLFLVTGCSTTYNIEIYNNSVTEQIDITDNSSFSGIEVQKKVYDLFETKLGGIDDLDRDFKPFDDDSDDYHSLRAITEFKLDDYKEKILDISNCCRAVNLTDDGKYITFETLGYFNWFEKYEDLDEITIKIKTNHKVKDHNADETGRHSYTWHIDRANYKEKIPSIKMYSDRYVFNYNNEFFKKVLPIIMIIGIIAGSGLIIYLYVRNKSNQADRI